MPDNGEAKEESDAANTPHEGCTVQSDADVDGEVEYPTTGTTPPNITEDGDAAVTTTGVATGVTEEDAALGTLVLTKPMSGALVAVTVNV